MDKIVDIQKRIESRKQKIHLKAYQKRKDALKRITQCSLCYMKCAICGMHLDASEYGPAPPETSGREFTLCRTCGEELEDFLALSDTDERSQAFWHNSEWEDMWSAWLKYQQAITRFVNSTEYKQLQEELDTEW